MSDSVRAANATRAQRAKAEHEAKSLERKNAQQTAKAAYLSGNGEFILEDLQAKIKGFQSFHVKIAQDGVGARPTGHKLTDGSQEVENIYLTSEQRANHLDKAAGQQEILDYITRQLTQPQPDQKPKSKQEPVA